MNINSSSKKSDASLYWYENNFILDLKGFEGPLHLLLNLSRDQKVDLRKISLVELCDQYLNFISEAKLLKIEIAADYLIMATWLVLLKSELLLPKDEVDEDLKSSDLEENLKFRLLRLDAMRNAGVKLLSRDQLYRDFFKRGDCEEHKKSKGIIYTASLLDILQAYAGLKTKEKFEPLKLKKAAIFSSDDALEIINKKLKMTVDWLNIDQFVPALWRKEPQKRRAAVATNFSVALEQARLRRIEIIQAKMFAPIYCRKAENF